MVPHINHYKLPAATSNCCSNGQGILCKISQVTFETAIQQIRLFLCWVSYGMSTAGILETSDYRA